MSDQSQMTISEVVKAFGDNRNTLNSWVRNRKIKSRKILRGKKETIVIDVASLEAYRATRSSSNDPKIEPVPESTLMPDLKSKTEMETKTESAVKQPDGDGSRVANCPASGPGGNDNPDTPKKGRKKPRVKSPRQHAKNLMRSFSNPELLNVQAWITQRLESRLSETTGADAI